MYFFMMIFFFDTYLKHKCDLTPNTVHTYCIFTIIITNPSPVVLRITYTDLTLSRVNKLIENNMTVTDNK